jgi:hypothetical protein
VTSVRVSLKLQSGKLLKVYLMAKLPPTVGVYGIIANQ